MRGALRNLFLLSRQPVVAAADPLTLNLDLTATLDSRITFTRAGARNYITAGVLTALGTGLPAFESWDGVDRGMAIEPGFTNLITYSNDFTNAAWTYTGTSTAVAGDAGSGVMTQLSLVASTVSANYHQIRRKPGSVTAGVRQTFAAFVKVAAGATNYSCYLRMSNEFENNGLRCFFRLDGSDGFYPVPDTSKLTDAVFGYRKLTGGVYHVSITGTWVGTSNKEYILGVTGNALLDTRNFTAATTDAVQVYGVSITTTGGAVGYVDTVASTLTQAAESAVFNDTSWLTSTAVGTFVVEHDCWFGPIIGSGTNTVLTATVPGKTAIAWSGSTSDTVNNGGATTAGGLPTFSGSDVRLLSTSSASNTGHIKSIKFYNTRLTVAEMQALTSPTVVSTATPGVLRGASTKNRLPSVRYTTSGAALYHQVRFQVPIGSSAYSSLKLDFPAIFFPATSTGNDVIVDSCYFERVTGVAESVQVLLGGSGSFTVTNGAAATVLSDSIATASFTGLTQFDDSVEFWVRLRCRVTTAGHKFVGARSKHDPAGAFCIEYDPAVTTPSAVSSTGVMTYSGSAPASRDYGYCPILVGIPVAGDPVTMFTTGDSLTEGITASTHQGPGLYVKKACMALGIPNIEHSKGGQSHRELALATGWTPYLKYARVLADGMGTNNLNAYLDFFTYFEIAKSTYGYDKLIHFGLTPVATSTDSYVTEANQTITRAYPHAIDTFMVELAKYGLIDVNHVPMVIRGANTGKWIVTGAANYATSDGTHWSVAADDLMETEFQPVLAAVTVS